MTGILYVGARGLYDFCGVARKMVCESDALIAKIGIATLWNADLVKGGLSAGAASLKGQFAVVKNFKGALELGRRVPYAFTTMKDCATGRAKVTVWDVVGSIASIFNSVSDAAEFAAPYISAAYVGTAKAAGNVATRIGMSYLFMKDAGAAYEAYNRSEWGKMGASLLDMVRDVSYFSLASISSMERSLGKKAPAWVSCALYTSAVGATALAFCQRNWGKPKEN